MDCVAAWPIRLTLAAMLFAAISGQTTAPQDDDDGFKALRRAIAELTDEANGAIKNGRLPRSRADFADHFDGTPNSVALANRLLRPVHANPIVDAYVRWQLTSFKPPVIVPAVSERTRFNQVVNDLPPLRMNPWAERGTMNRLLALSKQGRLSDADAAKVNDLLNDLTRDAAEINELNLSALGLRQYCIDNLDADKPAQLLFALERCRAMMEACVNVDEEKTRLEAMFAEAGRSGTLTKDQVRIVTTAAESLVARRAPFIAGARLQDNTLILDLAMAAVDDFEVRRWVKQMTNDE